MDIAASNNKKQIRQTPFAVAKTSLVDNSI